MCKNDDFSFEASQMYRLKSRFQLGVDQIVRLLLENGADVNGRDDRGWTSLHWASYRGMMIDWHWILFKISKIDSNNCLGHGKVAKVLFEYGANVNVMDSHQWTPIQMAACRSCFDKHHHSDSEEIIRELIKKGANVNIKNYAGLTALHWAVVGQGNSSKLWT